MMSNTEYQKFGTEISTPGLGEGDWLLGAHILVAAVASGKPTKITNLNLRSDQKAKRIIEALDYAGVTMSLDFEGVEIAKSVIKPFSFDSSNCPELIYPLVALAAMCPQECRIAGGYYLCKDSSSPIETLKSEFEKLGVELDISHPNLIVVKATKTQQKATLESHSCEGLALCLAALSLRYDHMPTLDGETVTENLFLRMIENREIWIKK